MQIKKLLPYLAVLLLVSLPFLFVVKIDYVQNDEYIHYQAVQKLMGGNFSLPSYLGSNFYVQGLTSLVFAYFFGISKLPVLTYLFAVLCFAAFLAILRRLDKLNFESMVLCGFILFLNPIFIYSAFGFMSEIYFLLFFLLSCYFISKFNTEENLSNFSLINIFSLLSFMVRQMGILTLFAFLFYLFYTKKFRYVVSQIIILVLVGFSYLEYFPFTKQMLQPSFKVSNLYNVKYIFSVFYIIGVYLTIFSIPLIVKKYLIFINNSKGNSRIVTTIFLIILSLFSLKYSPMVLQFESVDSEGKTIYSNSNTSFPYLPNIFTSKGFLSNNLSFGEKYDCEGCNILFNILEFAGKIGLPFFVFFLFLKFYEDANFYSIYIFVSIIFLSFITKIYDRYLIAVIPVSLLLLYDTSKNKRIENIFKMISITYLIIFGFLIYNFSMDYFLVNKYITNKSNDLIVSQKIIPNEINADHAWRQTFPNPDNKWNYYFVYEGTDKLISKDFEVLEQKEIKFPLSIYKEPFVYLVKRVK